MSTHRLTCLTRSSMWFSCSSSSSVAACTHARTHSPESTCPLTHSCTAYLPRSARLPEHMQAPAFAAPTQASIFPLGRGRLHGRAAGRHLLEDFELFHPQRQPLLNLCLGTGMCMGTCIGHAHRGPRPSAKPPIGSMLVVTRIQ